MAASPRPTPNEPHSAGQPAPTQGCPSRQRRVRAILQGRPRSGLHRRPRSIPLGLGEYARQLPAPGGQDPILRTRPPAPGNSLRGVWPPSDLLALDCSEREKARLVAKHRATARPARSRLSRQAITATGLLTDEAGDLPM